VFGPVTFEQDFLSESYLRGYINFNEGDPFANDVLIELQKSLYDSGQFNRVEVAASRDEAVDLAVPVKLILEPGPSRRFTAGVGYGTDTGPRFRTGWEHRRVNRDVHRLRADLLVSRIKTRLSGRYSIPLRRPRTDTLEYSAAAARERVGEIDSDSLLLGVSRNWLRGRTSYSAFLKYLWENYDVATDEGRTTLLIPGLGLSYVKADNRVVTGKGYRVDWELQGSDDGILSDFSFLQARLTVKTIYSLGKHGRIIIRAEGGSTWVNDFSAMPATLRFFAGGDQSVRGFAYKSLGPEDASGRTVGGPYLLVGSIEYEHRLTEKWSGAVFSDIGNALDDPGDPLERGTGAGLRWKTVIGLVRLDVAWAVSREDNPWRIHLNIGPDL
jgi:translocation and assembly module TamA